jgi:hypothetical protein
MGAAEQQGQDAGRADGVAAADLAARIMITMTATMIPAQIADTAQMKRLTEFATDVLELADERPDLELRRQGLAPRRLSRARNDERPAGPLVTHDRSALALGALAPARMVTDA